ncbi:uncharacterized protein LOC135840275 [Planococcus citri]|uniref:uncharacterized protein LOC135840275 n=1 Tax=Planococcus citri TaxID=170843 RepID=UPI0031F94E9C
MLSSTSLMDTDENDYNYIEEVFCTPEFKDEANTPCNIALLPEKSRHRYEATYESFEKWREEHKQPSTYSEEILMKFFEELSATKSPSTLWCTYSMLKGMIKLKHDIDIGKYSVLIALLKKRSKGYTAVTAPVFTDEDVAKFINEAPDALYLVTKVALIFGILGACRTDELTNLRVQNIETHGRIFLVKIPKPDQPSITRSFTVSDHYYDIVEKYRQLRPLNVKCDRFFLSYRQGKCTIQVIGKHKFACMPREIATFLELENAHLYTGHSIRKTSSSLLANAGADRRTVKRHGTWKSTTEVQGYIDSSLHIKRRTETTVESSISQPASTINQFVEDEVEFSSNNNNYHSNSNQPIDEENTSSINNTTSCNSNDSDSVLPDESTNTLPVMTCSTSFKNKTDVVLDLPMSVLYENNDNDSGNRKSNEDTATTSLEGKRLDLIKKHFAFYNCTNIYINFK